VVVAAKTVAAKTVAAKTVAAKTATVEAPSLRLPLLSRLLRRLVGLAVPYSNSSTPSRHLRTV